MGLRRRADSPGSSGGVIDHVAAAFAGYRAKGDTVTAEPRPFCENHYGFIEDPNGVRIEVIQRPKF